MSNSGTLPPLRQHWTDDGIEKLLLVRAEREIEFDEVLGKTKGKKGQAGPTQSGLWELVAEELQSRYVRGGTLMVLVLLNHEIF